MKKQFGFQSSLRVKYPSEYKKFFDAKEVHRGGPFVVFVVPNELGHPRLGLTVKVTTNHVERNKVRRWTRETFRLNQAHLGSKDYNVVVSKPVRDLSSYHQKISDFWKRLGSA